MMKTFTYYMTSALWLLIFITGAGMPGKSWAQKKGTAYLNNPVVYINLMLPSGDSLLLVDGTGALYADKFSASVDENDAGKLPNFNENICLARDGQQLAIETRPIPKLTDTLFVHMWGVHNKKYSLQIVCKAIPLMLPVKALLVDDYLNTQTPVNLFTKAFYDFKVNGDMNSYLDRFKIVFVRAAATKADSTLGISKAVQLNRGSVTAYPNPLSGNRLVLHFNNMPKDRYAISLTSLSGKFFSGLNIIHTGGNNEYYLPVNPVYNKGVYTITISGKNYEKTIHLPIVIN